MIAGFTSLVELTNLLRVWQAFAAVFRILHLGYLIYPGRLPIVLLRSVVESRITSSLAYATGFLRTRPTGLGLGALVAGPWVAAGLVMVTGLARNRQSGKA